METELFLNYGILGFWTATLLWEKYKFTREMKNTIEKNTTVLKDLDSTIKGFLKR